MAASSNNIQAFLAILLLLLPMAAKGDVSDDMCEVVQCGRGSCESNPNVPFNFSCNCQDGWRQTRLNDELNLEFLPCLIPECSLDYSCMPSAPPPPPFPNNSSLSNPCDYIYCGEGTCERDSTYTYKCQCNYGHYNLFNISAFPCYSDCALGSDCERLGIPVSRTTTNPYVNNNYGNQGTSFLPRKMHWVVISLISIVMTLWK
ncbi:Hypothetical predicted protein [Olea europaea subsp. europaea]|uniref:Uncharacterized protein n=1 Tax=Olea europaea subsp. europaea TaxID=158383 RepID=A0A8S0URJ5_OLEEU|nr:Hypothetical predicted protein [Olea europaea subsp. europaea]